MDTVLQFLFGEGPKLEAHHMVFRAVAVFAFTLVSIRLSGRRSFGQYTPFDACITVLLGAVLSRAITGASPFLPTMAAGATLVFVHRLLAMAAVRFPFFDRWMNGKCRTLLADGRIDAEAMRKGLVCEHDLRQAVRRHMHADNLGAVRKAVLERDGAITVLR